MQDIGGCRAVVNAISDLRRLEARICNGQLPVIGGADYIATPRASGYRGVHIVVSYEGRAIEIQLRTGVMHEWARRTERYSQNVRLNLKQDGDHPIQLFLQTASEIMALQELGEEVPASLQNLHNTRRLAAEPYLREENT